MNYGIYSVRDAKADAFHPPMYLQNDDMAIRAFGSMTRDENSLIHLYPEDYALWHLGTFDDGTGELGGNASCVITGVELLRSRQS